MVGPNKNWREILQQRPLNEQRIATYGRIMDAEDRLEGVRRRRGVNETALGDALEASEAGRADGPQADVFLDTVTRYIAALGGHLEVRAVFPDETVTLFRGPRAE